MKENMKLGFKIAFTGIIVMLTALSFVRGEWPGTLIGASLLIAVFGGLAAAIVGILIIIWSA